MADGAPFIDPELIAAGQLLKSHGLAALSPASSPIADVRAMQDQIGAFLGEGSTPLQHERDLVHRFDILVASGNCR